MNPANKNLLSRITHSIDQFSAVLVPPQFRLLAVRQDQQQVLKILRITCASEPRFTNYAADKLTLGRLPNTRKLTLGKGKFKKPIT